MKTNSEINIENILNIVSNFWYKYYNLMNNLLVIIAFFILASVYMWPCFKGMIIIGNDYNTTRQMSKSMADHREKYNEEPLWNDSMFAGMPGYLISTKHPKNILYYIGPSFGIFMFIPFFYFIWLISVANENEKRCFKNKLEDKKYITLIVGVIDCLLITGFILLIKIL